ncbi:2-C-methyl-D-erythritol 4-phosphate cytidylyltransferase [Streptomyces sp. NBC_00859]|uniref:2-C-methyl-D-erythritol 4-phosphate cytidylyltransferase n=1 Tax=Streptomyces sp. NBC_00859 TaxID=2903682 RepID=UPI00386B5B7C
MSDEPGHHSRTGSSDGSSDGSRTGSSDGAGPGSRTGPRAERAAGAGHTTAAVIPAAGRGVRLGPGAPKALRAIDGTPMLVHAVRAMAGSRAVSLVVVVAPPDGAAEVEALLAGHLCPAGTELLVVPGGDTRQESVRLGIGVLPGSVSTVLVHDAARPLVPVGTVDAVIAAVRNGAPAVVPALPLADTVKQVEPRTGGAPEPVVATPVRALLRAVQTPQGFDRALLARAHATVTHDVTDDASMVEQLGVQVVVVPGHEEAFKVTRPLDLVLAEAVLARRRENNGF